MFPGKSVETAGCCCGFYAVGCGGKELQVLVCMYICMYVCMYSHLTCTQDEMSNFMAERRHGWGHLVCEPRTADSYDNIDSIRGRFDCTYYLLLLLALPSDNVQHELSR